ncbi:MAG: AraC family transcriptional regulator ligand-binding domain-containing protein [Alphaproteobacteria bacterium]|jgi:AraC-like DNA-binding protein
MSDRLDSASIPNANGTLTRQAYARAATAGIEVQPLLDKAGLTQQQVLDSKARLPVRSQIRFVNFVATAVKDDLLGFHLAQMLELRDIGLLYYVIASSDRTLEALRRAARYSSIVNEGFALQCIDKREIGFSAFHWIGQDRHQSEYLLTALVRTCRALTGQTLRPASVRFVHFRKTVSAEFPQMFGDNIEFGADTDELLFSEHVRDMPVVSADPYLNKLLLGYCDEALARRRAPAQSFRTRVENAIAPLLPHGNISVEHLARALGVSRRTFARKLASEGVTFRELLESMRQDLANRHLADRDLSISQVAWLLGYQDVGAFSHAFRRWTGNSPRTARATLLPGGTA